MEGLFCHYVLATGQGVPCSTPQVLLPTAGVAVIGKIGRHVRFSPLKKSQGQQSTPLMFVSLSRCVKEGEEEECDIAYSTLSYCSYNVVQFPQQQ